MNTVPTTPTDAGHCQLDWCTNRRGHRDQHVRVVGVVEPTPFNNNVQAVLVTVEAGRGEVDPLPVVALAGDGESFRRSVRLDWREAEALAGLLERAIEDFDPDAIVQRHMLGDQRGNTTSVEVSTAHSHDDWQRALVRIGASGTLEATGTAIVVAHDATDETLRLHAPERTDVERVREVVSAAAVALGIV